MILERIPRGEKFFEVVVTHCFIRNGLVLLLKKRENHPIYPGLWGFTAGKVKSDLENLEMAACREIMEETGNVFFPDQIERTGIAIPVKHVKASGEPFYFIAHVMALARGTYLSDVIIDKKEHISYKLESPANLLGNSGLALIPDARETFRLFCDSNGIIAKAT